MALTSLCCRHSELEHRAASQLHQRSQIKVLGATVPLRQAWSLCTTLSVPKGVFTANRQTQLVPSILFMVLREHVWKNGPLCSPVGNGFRSFCTW